ncbi:hypothetical protein CCR75_005344 [Bremia lactucae]|uniref:ERCC1-like central domain-containing protein n=1 Tax=Bremia lactucae TaxID=4779 RepID=A0A976FI78_BRELC|nr:hypothetical protein CCR75_005344 [Bremia lactucae]
MTKILIEATVLHLENSVNPENFVFLLSQSPPRHIEMDSSEASASNVGDDKVGAVVRETLPLRSNPDSLNIISVPSLLDSRTQLKPPGSDGIDNDAAPRYLPREDGSAQTSLKFSEAFAQLRKTSSYVAPPLLENTNSVRDASATVYVNRRQRGNPMLKAVRNVGLEFRDGLIPDYVISEHFCYDNEVALREINRVALFSEFTLVLAWSWLEAARYLETIKAYENKSATIIKEKVEAEFLPKANDVLTSIRSVNKTDVITLLSTFGTVKGLMNASMEELALCPGLGAKKVRQLLETFLVPFTKQ